MASNYDNYSHKELIRELHLHDRLIDLLKQGCKRRPVQKTHRAPGAFQLSPE
jgi:hypothetical protein